MKIKLIVVVLLVLLLLAGCSKEVAYPFMQAQENITAIEIIVTPNYEIPEDYSALDALVAVEQEDWQAFLEAFREIPCKHAPMDPLQGFSGDQVIRITYTDGGYEVIGPYAGLHIAADGSGIWKDYYLDKEAFERLVRAQILEYGYLD